MGKRVLRILAVLLCLLLFVGSTPVHYPSVDATYVAETILYGNAVCPSLLPGSEDGSVVIRWASDEPWATVLHFGPDDGSGRLRDDHQTVLVRGARSKAFGGVCLSAVELKLEPGEYLYGLTEEEGDSPTVLYPIHWRQGESFRVVMSSDSHLYNGKDTALYEEAIAAGIGEQGADLVIHGGDVNDNAQATSLVLSCNAAHTRSVPTLAVCGNHDMQDILYGFFTPPHMDPYTGDFWTIQNNILFVGLNVTRKDRPAHRRYLSQVLPAHREGCDWVVLIVHFSMMSNGEHGWDPAVTNLRGMIRDVIAENDVDLVLSGHDHEYDRSFLIGAKDMVEGSGGAFVEKRPGETLYISLPTAVGNKLYSNSKEPLYPLAVEGDPSARGYVTAEFSKERILFRAWNADTGIQMDCFILSRAKE